MKKDTYLIFRNGKYLGENDAPLPRFLEGTYIHSTLPDFRNIWWRADECSHLKSVKPEDVPESIRAAALLLT